MKQEAQRVKKFIKAKAQYKEERVFSPIINEKDRLTRKNLMNNKPMADAFNKANQNAERTSQDGSGQTYFKDEYGSLSSITTEEKFKTIISSEN